MKICGSSNYIEAATGCLLMSSILLNVFLLRERMSGYEHKGEGPGLTWTEAAARDAEVVAGVYCSGHGTAYLDGSGGCECHDCYSGPDCSVSLVDSCIANADGFASFL